MARSLAPRPFRSILCPVDFSVNSRAALRFTVLTGCNAENGLARAACWTT